MEDSRRHKVGCVAFELFLIILINVLPFHPLRKVFSLLMRMESSGTVQFKAVALAANLVFEHITHLLFLALHSSQLSLYTVMRESTDIG